MSVAFGAQPGRGGLKRLATTSKKRTISRQGSHLK